MAWEAAAKGFKEMPKGVPIAKVWYNHAVVPLYVTIGVASLMCGGFMVKFFGGHTDVTWSKTLRADAYHNGESQHRVDTHNARYGMRQRNKSNISIFPFNFEAMNNIISKRTPVSEDADDDE